MERTTQTILTLAVAAVALIWLYPSWVYVSEDPLFGFRGTIGSYWILDPPMHYGAHLDYPKNLSYTALVVVAACGLILWCRWTRGPQL